MKIQKKKNKIAVNAETPVQPSDKVSQPETKIKMKKETDDNRVLSSIKKNKKKKKKSKKLSKIQKEETDSQTNGVSQIESEDLDVSEDVTPKKKKRSKSLENSVDKIDQTSVKKIKLDNKVDKSNQIQNKKNEAEPKNISLSVEELEEKIKAISSRENISKTARKNLAVLKKKLKVKQEFLASASESASVTSTVSGTEEEKLNAEKNPQTCDDKVKDDEKNKLEEIDSETQKPEFKNKLIADKRKQKKRVEKSKNLNNDGENMKEESNCDDDDDRSSSKKKKKIDNVNTSSDSKDIDEEETDMNEKQNASKKKKNETRTTNFVKKEMDEIKNLTDTKGGKEENEVNSSIGKKEIKDMKKKIRYVLFVGNIPYSTCVDDIKNHFLTKVSKVISVRIPTAKQTHSPRGIAYVEFSDSTDYEKGLSLHHSILNGRRINVQYTQSGSKNAGKKSEIVSKNKKLHALRRQGKLAGSVKHTQKRNNKRNFKKSQTT